MKQEKGLGRSLMEMRSGRKRLKTRRDSSSYPQLKLTHEFWVLARGRIRAVATGLCHSHSNTRSEHICNLHYNLQQRQILNPLSEARDLTCILMDATQIPFRWATTGIPRFFFFFSMQWILFFRAVSGSQQIWVENTDFQNALCPHTHTTSPLSRSGNTTVHFVFLFFVFLPLLGPLPTAYGGSQARGQIGAVASSLHQSHSSAGSEPRLQPTP